MTDASRYPRVKRLIKLRWVPRLLSAMLLCFSAAGTQAHGVSAPAQNTGRIVTTSRPTAASVTIMSQTVDRSSLVGRGDQECPVGSNHIKHAVCAGIACHVAAVSAGLAADFPSSHGAYAR